MDVTLQPKMAEELADYQLKRETESTGRDKGPQPVHVSDLLICLVRSWYKRHRPELAPEEVLDAGSKFRMADGVVAQGFLDGMPGEQEVEVTLDLGGVPVVGHVDSVIYDEAEVFPVEMKSTGARLNMPTSTHYFEQLAAYALALGARAGYLVVKNNPPPLTLTARLVEWSETELQSWRTELTHRAQELMDSSEPPNQATHYSWACNYCPLKGNVCPGGKGEFDGGFFSEDL